MSAEVTSLNFQFLSAYDVQFVRLAALAERYFRDDPNTCLIKLAADATSVRQLTDRLDQAILAKAFRGELVPQDPTDEPAEKLLERIRAERGAAPARRGRGRAQGGVM
jgi:hypothetical protein